MKRIVTLLLIISSLNCFLLFPQKLNLFFENGIGTYEMTDLKKYNNLVITSLPFEAKVTDDFPAFWYFKYSFQYTFNNFLSTGIVYTKQSTGSRIAVADYSGEFKLDMKTVGNEGGVFIEAFKQYNHLKISALTEFGITYSTLDFYEFIRIGDISEKRVYKYKTNNWFGLQLFRFSYQLSFFEFGLNTGYHFNLSKSPFEEVSGYPALMLSKKDKACPDWSGFRFGLFLSFGLDLSD